MADVRVVGVAVLAGGPAGRRLLAARRTSPAEAAGAWELPGGKVDEGEPLATAAVREVHEELGCTVRITGTVHGAQSIRPGYVLQVVTAELVDGEPVPLEHDALRWLGPGELGTVRWLPADVPFLAGLADRLRDPREDAEEHR